MRFVPKPLEQILRLPEVIEVTGLSRSTIYRMMDKGDFPKGKKLRGTRSVGWWRKEVEEWVRDQFEKESGSGIR